MNFELLRIASKPIAVLQLALSVFLLLRGHNEPGGGFIGGLIAASAFVLVALAHDVELGKSWMKLDPKTWIVIGLLSACFSGLIAPLLGKPLMTSIWGGTIWFPLVSKVKLGTPLLFDIGVYWVVIGISTLIIFTLLETEKN